MGLQRTPPPSSRNEARQDDEGQGEGTSRPRPSTIGETSLPSPARAFQPRNPRVMRSPLSGSTTTRPEPPMYQDEVPALDADVSTTPRTAPPPARAPDVETKPDEMSHETSVADTTTSINNTEAHPSTTPLPANKRRKSRHTSTQPEPVPIPSQIDDADDEDPSEETRELSQFEKNALYGKRYQVMMDTLELAIKASSEKWTLAQFTECFPRFAAQNRDQFVNIWEEYRTKMKTSLRKHSTDLLEDNRFGQALRKIEDVVQEAKMNGTEQGRSNAWRPDLTVKTVAAAANLPIHDATYARLRAEYLQLHQDCTERYTSIADKQAQLKDLESTVSDGVVDLDKTIKLLDGFPSEDMVKWMEGVLSSQSASKV